MDRRRFLLSSLVGSLAAPLGLEVGQASKVPRIGVLLGGVHHRVLRAGRPEELGGAFAAMREERAGALLVVADPMFYAERVRLAGLAAKHRLPAMYGLKEHAEVGGLMSYAADFADLYRRAAGYVDKILKGARPSDLPIEQPTKFELVINLKTALGLTIPPSLLARADQVIE